MSSNTGVSEFLDGIGEVLFLFGLILGLGLGALFVRGGR